MAPVTSYHACGKSECKLLRCGRCRIVWFCSRKCQVVAARQGHSGANCRTAEKATKHTDAEEAPSSPDAGLSFSPPLSSTMVLAANSCHACSKSGCKLLLCGRCRNAWFCSRECQVVARKELGHRGAHCRAADGAQRPPPPAAPSQPSTPMDAAKLGRRFNDLIGEAQKASMANTRIGSLAAAHKCREAAAVADLIDGAEGAGCHVQADQLLSSCLSRLGDNAAAAIAACSSARAARASGSRTNLVTALCVCGQVANKAPGEMPSAERESREQERRSGSSSYGGLDLSQEGRVSLPTNPAGLVRLCLAYHEAAVALCDEALAAAGGRGSPAAPYEELVPTLRVEARARCCLGDCLDGMGEERQRSLEILRQAVMLWRQVLRTATPGRDTGTAQLMLADQLSTLGAVLKAGGSEQMTEAGACMREALALGEGLGDVILTEKTLVYLINLGGVAHAAVEPAEAEAFRLQLNQLLD